MADLECDRPYLSNDKSIKNGDLVRIESRGFVFICFIDDSIDDFLRPATPSSAKLEQWLDAPDWETLELIERSTVIGA